MGGRRSTAVTELSMHGKFWLLAVAIGLGLFMGSGSSAMAADEAVTVSTGISSAFVPFWLLGMAAAIAALGFAWYFFKTMLQAEEGTERMREIAQAVREGADAYLWQQYRVVALFFVGIVIVLSFFAFVLEAQSRWVPFAFLTGGFFSALAGWCGMKTATLASSRTAAGAQLSLNRALQVAFRSGAVMGLTVVGLGLLDICLWFFILYWFVSWLGYQMSLVDITVTMLCFGMGASTQALFARVGGGIFTKAADVGADLVGKVEAGIPEDDPRNPAVIADNVGDNVGDVAGMGADLYESYCGSILASAALGVAAFAGGEILPKAAREAGTLADTIHRYQLAAIFLPILLAAAGIVLSIWGVFLVRTDDEQATQRTLLKALRRGIYSASGAVVIAAIVLTWLLLGWDFIGIAVSVIVGLLAGVIIGFWTEYSTSEEYLPTRELSKQALTGPATVVIGGIADGMKSTWVPVLTVCVATVLAFGFACGWRLQDPEWFALGLYGVGVAAVGMLSTLGITLATDAYGPIADNAGGNAQMSHLDPEVRRRTDALDALGNTTAATGKGFAIGSAALTALALLAAYVEEVRVGFVRWERSALADYSQPGYYKLTDTFIAHLITPRSANTPAKIEGFLAFQDEVQNITLSATTIEELKKSSPHALPPRLDREVLWTDLDTSRGPVLIPEKCFQEIKDRYGRRGLLLSPEGSVWEARLIPVHEATMLDFMRYYRAHLMNPGVLVGVFIGAMSVFLFCALTMKAVGRAAFRMVEEVRKQFRERPGIMAGTERPDYRTPVAISTRAAQVEMILPSVLGLLTPLAVGMIIGVSGVVGLLAGALTTGFCMAIFMANAGGTWDNAKKHIEGGAHGGKGTDAHKAAVVGDTVGDPFKDTSGPSLNILIKLMSMVSVVAAGLIVRYALQLF
ncbi:MAG: sodium-translocating pyrophosphatase [Thermoguttaceae bacterium]|nr:sodium-translocating pyrophosphatase [Thermoguttaceae bacterium]MDW8077939.1 sodium-translocating pyrophosphatase [Thermoguttaceae bacterium]